MIIKLVMLCIGINNKVNIHTTTFKTMHVVAEDAEPSGEVGGVVGSGDGGESGLCAPHGGAELGDEFFGGVGVVAESAGEVSVEAAGVSGPVDGFLSAPRWLVSSDSCCVRLLVVDDAACAGDGAFGGGADEVGVAVGPAGEVGEAVVIGGEHVGIYLHHNRKAGALVAINGGTDEFAKDLATHVAAMNPLYKSEAEIPADAKEKIIAFFEKETAESDKPAEIKAKILEGKVKGYLSEQTLIDQPFFKNPEETVGKALEKAGATVVDFVRIKLG